MSILAWRSRVCLDSHARSLFLNLPGARFAAVFSYAFSHDLPQFLVTSGPYSYIRNPFYASYLLAYVAAAILFPGIATLGVLMMMGILLTKAARYEERKFQSSALADEYKVYKQRTGRFIPETLSSIVELRKFVGSIGREGGALLLQSS